MPDQQHEFLQWPRNSSSAQENVFKKKKKPEAQGKISPYFLLEQASVRVEDQIKFLLGPEVLLCPQKLNYRETSTIPTA